MTKLTGPLMLTIIGFLLTACGGGESSSSGGGGSSGSSSLPSSQQQAQDQFCSDLNGLGTALNSLTSINAQSSPAQVAQAANNISTSYDAVRREALSVPNVDMTPVNNAYGSLASTAQSIPSNTPPAQAADMIQVPAKNLAAAVTTTQKQANCPATSTTSGPAPTPQATTTNRP